MFVFDEHDASLWSYIGEGQMIRVPERQGILAEVMATDRTIQLNDAASDPQVDSIFGEATDFVTRSLVCAPMHGERGQLFGCLQVSNKKNKIAEAAQDPGFSKQDQVILTDFAHHLGPVVQGWLTFSDHKSGLETQLTQAVAGERQLASVISFLLESGGPVLRDTIGEELAIQLLTAAASVSDGATRDQSPAPSPGRQSPMLMMNEDDFSKADLDGDGHLDKDELKAFWAK